MVLTFWSRITIKLLRSFCASQSTFNLIPFSYQEPGYEHILIAPARDSKAIYALTSTGIIAAASTLFRFPTGYLKELNAAQGGVRSRISVKHEHARTGHDSALAGREQCTLLWPKLCRP